MKKKKHVCPNGCNSTFFTVDHVMQEWEVDAYGNFIKTTEDCILVSHNPEDGNVWTCSKCGMEAIIIES